MNTLAPDPSPPGHARTALTSSSPLIVVAGIPGASKSTALEKLAQDLQAGGSFIPAVGLDPVILDSASVRRWLRSRLPQVPVGCRHTTRSAHRDQLGRQSRGCWSRSDAVGGSCEFGTMLIWVQVVPRTPGRS